MTENSGSKSDVPDLIPARMLSEFAYCPRLCYVEWIDGDFVDSEDTVDGRFQHRRVDSKEDSIPREEFENVHARSLFLSGPKVGITCRIDLLEGDGERVRDKIKGSCQSQRRCIESGRLSFLDESFDDKNVQIHEDRKKDGKAQDGNGKRDQLRCREGPRFLSGFSRIIECRQQGHHMGDDIAAHGPRKPEAHQGEDIDACDLSQRLDIHGHSPSSEQPFSAQVADQDRIEGDEGNDQSGDSNGRLEPRGL